MYYSQIIWCLVFNFFCVVNAFSSYCSREIKSLLDRSADMKAQLTDLDETANQEVIRRVQRASTYAEHRRKAFEGLRYQVSVQASFYQIYSSKFSSITFLIIHSPRISSVSLRILISKCGSFSKHFRKFWLFLTSVSWTKNLAFSCGFLIIFLCRLLTQEQFKFQSTQLATSIIFKEQ